MNTLPEWGIASITHPGESESGDRYVVKPFKKGVLVAVVDGLGHGRDAAVAARLAIATLYQYAHEPPADLFLRCNDLLRVTRGVVMSMASFDIQHWSMTWLGVGNVSCTLMRADPVKQARIDPLFCRGGLVGSNLPELRPARVPVAPGDTLVFATDGVSLKFTEWLSPNSGAPQALADQIVQRYATHIDDALVLVFPCRASVHVPDSSDFSGRDGSTGAF